MGVGAFTYEQLASRVVFGNGSRAQIPAELARLDEGRAFLIVDVMATHVGDELSARLGAKVAHRWGDVVQHVPFELAERARKVFTEAGASVVVAIGGGSSTGLAKAIALTHGVPILAVPTTYAGSEQTTIYGLTSSERKQTGKNPVVLPRVVVYDPELTVGLPAAVTGPSAFNAIAHSVEALYATGANPITSALALEGVRAIARSLPVAIEHPADLDARADLLYGAYLSGVALGTTSAGLHHKICHILGGAFNLVHADAHSVVLPHVVAFNGAVLPEEMSRLADALAEPGGDPAGALWDLAAASSVPTSLAALGGQGRGLRRQDLAEVARQVTAETTHNPRPVSERDVLDLLDRAFAGDRPHLTQ